MIYEWWRELNVSMSATYTFYGNFAFGAAAENKKNITNLSSYTHSETEEFVLSHGLNFCLPPINTKREEVLSAAVAREVRALLC